MPLLRALRTVRHLRAQQMAYMVLYRSIGARRRRRAATPRTVRRVIGPLHPRPYPGPPAADDHTFSFIGVTRRFPHGDIDWKCPEAPVLWRYNLHYFDYLLDETRSVAARDSVIDHWIANNPRGRGDAWAPYPTSLRIVNWVDYVLRRESARSVPESWLVSLHDQALELEESVEHHILANHILKNAVALVFAGTFFAGDDADRWLSLGRRLLAQEVEEQITADGGHYERSPMYHALVTQDLLDLLNLAAASRHAVIDEEKNHLNATVSSCLDFLCDILHPDGEIPLFNDSAFDIAATPREIVEYAARVCGYSPARLTAASVNIDKPASGYFGFRRDGNYFCIDCGPIGPDYQPGHAHCDLLSYELSMNGRRMVVDSGVFGYENDALRAYVRSTAAHNTLKVNGKEQSEIWSAFRVGRRARPLSARSHFHADGGFVFEGSHDGFRCLPQRVTHARRVHYDAAVQCFRITDSLSGRGRVHAESFVHLHPDLHVRREGYSRLSVLDAADIPVLSLEADDDVDITTVEGSYCARFGSRSGNQVVMLSKRKVLPFDMHYALRKRRP